MGTFAGLEQLELRAARNHFLAEADERLDEVAESQRLGPAAADREHIGREARLRRRVPPQLVEHDFRGGIALEVDDDPHAFAIGFVADVGHALDPPVLGRFGDLFDEAVLADLVRDFGENDRAPVAAAFLDMMAGPHHHRAAPGSVRATDTGEAEDEAAGREVRALHMLHQAFGTDRRIFDIGAAGREHFAQIVWRDVGGHADRDSTGSVDQQVGESGR